MSRFYKWLMIIVLMIWIIPSFAQNSKYSNSEEFLFNVSVVGAVDFPGIYALPLNSRISNAISIANDVKNDTLNFYQATNLDTLEIPNNIDKNILRNPLQPSFKASTRNIILKRDNQERTLDLEKYLTLGDISQNPFIQDGDVIIVPVQKEHIEIYGQVGKFNSRIELTPGDKLMDIIEIAFGIKPDADLKNVEVVRFVDETSKFTTIKIDVSEIIRSGKSDKNIQLQDDDRIYIRRKPGYHEKTFVTLVGEIQYPGVYAIENDVTLLTEIIERAGGLTEDTDLKTSYLQRNRIEDIQENEFNKLSIREIEDISRTEYQFLFSKNSESNNIFARNFEKIVTDKSKYNIELKDQDIIVFSAKTSVIDISGEVANPGLIVFKSELNFLDYIELSGGFTNQAWKGKIKIIRGNTGNWIKPDEKTTLYPGDTIFIPRQERFSYYWPYIKETVTFITGLATSIIVIQSLIN